MHASCALLVVLLCSLPIVLSPMFFAHCSVFFVSCPSSLSLVLSSLSPVLSSLFVAGWTTCTINPRGLKTSPPVSTLKHAFSPYSLHDLDDLLHWIEHTQAVADVDSIVLCGFSLGAISLGKYMSAKGACFCLFNGLVLGEWCLMDGSRSFHVQDSLKRCFFLIFSLFL